MVDGYGLDCICCQVSNLHSVNVNCVPLSGVAGTVGLILKQGSCTQEGYVKVKQFSAPEGQPDTGVQYLTMSCTTCSYIIYSNMTHFLVGHNDEVSVHSNGDIGDSELTRA